jgi:hypothetical protein
MKIEIAELTKINLGPNDTLLVKLKGEEFLNDHSFADVMKKNFEKVFPENRVILMTMPYNHDVELSAINENSENKGCNTASYCADCSCGKKERLSEDNLANLIKQNQSDFAPPVEDDICPDDCPGCGMCEADGPWAEGWEERSGKKDEI